MGAGRKQLAAPGRPYPELGRNRQRCGQLREEHLYRRRRSSRKSGPSQRCGLKRSDKRRRYDHHGETQGASMKAKAIGDSDLLEFAKRTWYARHV
jgi:hypothetical protein